jgi:hypothetical protein
MSETLITNLSQVTTVWLTAVLSRSGALKEGAVASFDSDAGRGNWSSNAILDLSYGEGARGNLPQRLFLKLVDTGASSSDEFFGDSEVTYYTRDYIDVEDAPIIRCYDAAFSSDLHCYHLLLDDLSETHIEAAEKFSMMCPAPGSAMVANRRMWFSSCIGALASASPWLPHHRACIAARPSARASPYSSVGSFSAASICVSDRSSSRRW